MKYRIFAIVLLLSLCLQLLTPAASAAGSDLETTEPDQITESLLALQEEYPDGMPWTNSNPSPSYVWKFRGAVVSMCGCAALTAIFQDRVFGSIKDAPVSWQAISRSCPTKGMAENPVPYSWENLWPGDILQFPGHTVIVIQKLEDCVVIAEGNNGGKVRWGRKISKAGVSTAKYVLTRYSKAEPLMSYTDLPKGGHWSHDAVVWAILNHVAAPVSASRFGPEALCSRTDMVSFLWAAAGCPEPQISDMQFTDVPVSASYRKAVLWALENGITGGTSANSFSPDMLCTRAQALTFLWRAEGSPEAKSESNRFSDVSPKCYYCKTVSWAIEQHVTSGTSKVTFSPDRTITRAEAVAFLYRLYGAPTS